VGTGVLGSAISMDKDVMKRLLNHAGIPTAKFRVITSQNARKASFAALEQELGSRFFVKPANAGSSVGVSKVTNATEFAQAMRETFRFDEKVLVEEGIRGRELECGVLGNEEPEASVVGEVIVRDEFYSYEAKYLNENGAILDIPALLPAEISETVRRLAVVAFKVLNCTGMARADFFLTDDGRVLLNEINTVPGFANISMFPLLWKSSGASYSDLIDRLVTLALQRQMALNELTYDVQQKRSGAGVVRVMARRVECARDRSNYRSEVKYRSAPTMACCFWMSFPSFIGRLWKSCVSRSKTGR